MTSDRMMQVIGRIERAISRIESAVETTATHNRAQGAAYDVQSREIERLKAERHTLATSEAASRPLEQDPHAINPYSHDKALAALRSLDSLIDDLQKARRDG